MSNKNMQKYNFIEGIALADCCFEAYGSNYNELFRNAAEATFSQMVNLKSVKGTEKRTIELKADNIEELLYNFLSEIIALKDSLYMVFNKFDVKVNGKKNKFELKADLYGEEIDQKKHKLGIDVKAATYHQFKVWKEGKICKARVILDI